ncbi:hypothetical protein [Krasilnikovia sp. MM14-A1004]|uniref:hypothetical protein n=1 Tax=Krasilnikovia sp. MM14-A1004 TaxID=3373541 RepID=UPI00399C76F5
MIPQQQYPRQSDTFVKSYRYLRTALVGLLLCLGVAVFFQTAKQGLHPLASVSAYYYTPAQAIFVGALIGMAVCMIALQGTTGVEEVFLNLGGMCAAVVAVVPTSRGEDYGTAVDACRDAAGPLMTEKAAGAADCPSVLALADATRANVENNMVALLAVGLLGLVAAVLFARRDGSTGRGFRWAFGVAAVAYAAAGVAFAVSVGWFVDHAHYISAIGLFLCIIAVTVANALRHGGAGQGGPGQGGSPGVAQTLRAASDVLVRPPHRFDRYAWIAWAMVVVAVVGTVLVIVNAFALFWLEIVVALLFAVFWTVQTIEQLPPPAVRVGTDPS